MALETIVERLHDERDRLAKELGRVIRMIKAAGKGAEVAVQEYGRRTRAQRSFKAITGTAKKRRISAAARKKMSAAQRSRRARERAPLQAKQAPKATATKSKTAKTQTPMM